MKNPVLSFAIGYARGGLRVGLPLLALAIALGAGPAAAAVSVPVNNSSSASAVKSRARADMKGVAASADVNLVANWVVRNNLQKGHPFIIADKPGSSLFAFDAKGVLLAKTPALFGAMHSDELTDQQAGKMMDDVVEADKITPAGEFRGEGYKSASYGEAVRFARYTNSNLLIHRAFNEQRMKRLQSTAASDRRITYGCINVPPDFMDHVLEPNFSGPSTVFVLPEKQSAKSFFAIKDDPAFNALGGIMAAHDSFIGRFLQRAGDYIHARTPGKTVGTPPPAGAAEQGAGLKKKIA